MCVSFWWTHTSSACELEILLDFSVHECACVAVCVVVCLLIFSFLHPLLPSFLSPFLPLPSLPFQGPHFQSAVVGGGRGDGGCEGGLTLTPNVAAFTLP